MSGHLHKGSGGKVVCILVTDNKVKICPVSKYSNITIKWNGPNCGNGTKSKHGSMVNMKCPVSVYLLLTPHELFK